MQISQQFFFDFDGTLSTPQFVQRANDYAVCDRVELCCSLSEAEVVANFGGPARVEDVTEMFSRLEENGVTLFIISLGFTRAILHHLSSLGLSRFFRRERIFGQESERMLQVRHKKASLIQLLLLEHGWKKSQALFVDDDNRHLEHCKELGACNFLQVRGQGLSKAEMDMILEELVS